MSQCPSETGATVVESSRLGSLVLAIPPARRGAVLQSVVSFRPDKNLDEAFAIGPLRAAFAELWEASFSCPVPIECLRAVLEPPVQIRTVLEFSKLMLMQDVAEIDSALIHLVGYLARRVAELGGSSQLELFKGAEQDNELPERFGRVGDSVRNLRTLVERGEKFHTIYADPPWPYANEASRAAAVNHYPTMPVEEIRAEPVSELTEDQAHLHLWTTNAFLREALDVIQAWGFEFKSCLVWVKDEMGMGNYWRVSHEFLLLGVRGSLRFQDRTLQSWIRAGRTVHSRKPGKIRSLIERASPAPYLELYGREELPNSAWTVYGNQVERRLF